MKVLFSLLILIMGLTSTNASAWLFNKGLKSKYKTKGSEAWLISSMITGASNRGSFAKRSYFGCILANSEEINDIYSGYVHSMLEADLPPNVSILGHSTVKFNSIDECIDFMLLGTSDSSGRGMLPVSSFLEEELQENVSFNVSTQIENKGTPYFPSLFIAPRNYISPDEYKKMLAKGEDPRSYINPLEKQRQATKDAENCLAEMKLVNGELEQLSKNLIDILDYQTSMKIIEVLKRSNDTSKFGEYLVGERALNKADAQLSYIYFAQVAHNSASALGCSSDDQRPKNSILCPEIKKVGEKRKEIEALRHKLKELNKLIN